MASTDFLLERSFYAGNMLGGIIYGLLLYVTGQSIYYLHKRWQDKRRWRIFYISYSAMMLLCMTFAFLTNALMGQMMWIDHRDFPGGPLAWYGTNGAIWFNVLGSAFDVFGNFMGDALLLYRCYVIWGSNIFVVIIPGLMFLASTALSIISVVESALPGSSFFQKQVVSFAVAWIAMTCSLNALLTALIIARVLYTRRRHPKEFPELESSFYSGVVAIFIESELPFSIIGIVFAVLVGKGNDVELPFSIIWGSLVGLSPQLIILRIAMGKAWSRHTLNGGASSAIFTTNSKNIPLNDVNQSTGTIGTIPATV